MSVFAVMETQDVLNSDFDAVRRVPLLVLEGQLRES
jgi:hypothetical protein